VRRTALACLAALVWLAPVRGQSPEQKKQTVEYLRNLQVKGGVFVPAARNREQSLRATSAALRALKYFSGEPRDKETCADFVKRCFDKASGGFTDQPGRGKPDVVITAVGLMAVVELKMPREPYVGPAVAYLGKNAKMFEEIRMAAAGLEAVGKRPPQADDWLKKLEGMRNEDGTFDKGLAAPRATGGAVVAELRLGGKVEKKDAILKVLRIGQRIDGAYGKAGATTADLETTYRVMRCYHMLGERPDVGRLRRFIARCRNDDGGYGLTPGTNSTVAATYFAGIILHWLDKP
jgi:prenyltransferase beta subunit